MERVIVQQMEIKEKVSEVSRTCERILKKNEEANIDQYKVSKPPPPNTHTSHFLMHNTGRTIT